MTTTGRPAFGTFAVLMFTLSCASTGSHANQPEQAALVIENVAVIAMDGARDADHVHPGRRIKLLNPKAAFAQMER